MFADDVAALLVLEGIGVLNKTIFVSSKAALPEGFFISIIETGGTAPEYTQGEAAPAYRHQGAQLTFGGEDYDVVAQKAEQSFVVLASVRNRFINFTWYLSISPLQEPFNMGPVDDKGRVRKVFNVIAKMRGVQNMTQQDATKWRPVV